VRLATGARLGPYEIVAPLGAGGMGEVYKARDSRLDRMVAVKVLASELAGDAEFRARFTREARAISALNHGNICGLYDIGLDHDTDYLVLELLEGETLAARLARGPLPPMQVLQYGIEIADALEAAHRQGIVHRDLKPGNVMLTPGGVKLLDFGLAKRTDAERPMLTTVATIPAPSTAPGMFVGTLPYMSPEQVQGLPTDARTDIFALGAMLYEMTTGRRAFEGTTPASLVAKILETDPPVVSSVAPLAPPALDHVIEGCLVKASADRWQTAHDVKMHLQWIRAQGSRAQAMPAAASRRRVPWWLATLGGAVLGAMLVATAFPELVARPVAPARPLRLDLTLPPEMRLEDYNVGALSPDGRRFVVEATIGGTPQLVVRDIASSASTPLPGSEGGWRPFWSPDGQSVAFFHPDDHLKQIALRGGQVQVLAEAPFSVDAAGTWRGDVIVFETDGRLYRVAATGGKRQPIEVSPPGGTPSRVVPCCFLPDGRHVLLSMVDQPGVYAASLDGPALKKILDQVSVLDYKAGHMFYARGTALFARPFDAERLAFSGPEVQVTDQGYNLSVSDDGMIVYRPNGGGAGVTLTWFDRAGRRTGTLGGPGPYSQVALSPRGRHATVERTDAQADDLWDTDLGTGIFSRMTMAPGQDSDPCWSPDERHIVFSSTRLGRTAPFVKDLVTGKEEPLVAFDDPVVVDQWTPDGRFVVVRTLGGKRIYAVPTGSDRTPRVLLDTPDIKDEIHVSPDGRWVAFNGDESGRWQVYVAEFPSFTSKQQVSAAGGVQPQWRADGRELFYLAGDGSMMSVRVDSRAGLVVGPPSRLFSTRLSANPFVPQYAVTADGQRFLGLEPAAENNSFTVLINWLPPTPADARRSVQ